MWQDPPAVANPVDLVIGKGLSSNREEDTMGGDR
jgi:hypothetical protein